MAALRNLASRRTVWYSARSTWAEHATNCAFGGQYLFVTATREADIEASQRTGTFWRVETDATGLDLVPGRL
jgi:sugar lactone lactonase YvrE